MRSRNSHYTTLVSSSLAHLHLFDEPVFPQYADAKAGLTKAELARVQDRELNTRLLAGRKTVRRPKAEA